MAGEFTLDVSQFITGMAEADLLVHEGAADGLGVLADLILAAAKAAAPQDDGDLRASGKTDVDRAGLEAAIGFGEGGDRVFIAAVENHERMDYNHPGGGGPKYLEQPFVAIGTGQGDSVLAAAIGRRLG